MSAVSSDIICCKHVGTYTWTLVRTQTCIHLRVYANLWVRMSLWHWLLKHFIEYWVTAVSFNWNFFIDRNSKINYQIVCLNHIGRSPYVSKYSLLSVTSMVRILRLSQSQLSHSALSHSHLPKNPFKGKIEKTNAYKQIAYIYLIHIYHIV